MKTVLEVMPNASNIGELVKCIRCKNTHRYAERLCKPDKKKSYLTHIVCPRCEARTTISTL